MSYLILKDNYNLFSSLNEPKPLIVEINILFYNPLKYALILDSLLNHLPFLKILGIFIFFYYLIN